MWSYLLKKFLMENVIFCVVSVRLNFRHLKIIRFLRLRYHPKIIADVLQIYRKQVRRF